MRSGTGKESRGHGNRGMRMIEEKIDAKVMEIAADETIPSGRVRIEKL